MKLGAPPARHPDPRERALYQQVTALRGLMRGKAWHMVQPADLMR